MDRVEESAGPAGADDDPASGEVGRWTGRGALRKDALTDREDLLGFGQSSLAGVGARETSFGRLHAGQVRLADGTLTTFNPGAQSVFSLKALPGDGLLLGLYGPSTGLRVTGPVARFGPWTPVAAPTLTRAPRVTGAAAGTETHPTDAQTDGGEWSA